jgi:hemerythrin-like domain-containing protein
MDHSTKKTGDLGTEPGAGVTSRRRWIGHAGLACAGLLAVAPAVGAQPEAEEEVSPPEDLMREHGVLTRVLLVYEEVIRRIDGKLEVPPDAVRRGADIIRSFIEDYHEKLEEDHVFPRFEKAGRLTDLRASSGPAPAAASPIESLARNARMLKDRQSATMLRDVLRQFIRMYNPHEAREDTVLFPQLRSVVPKEEFGALGDEFEKKEHDLFGEGGFERDGRSVAAISGRSSTSSTDSRPSRCSDVSGGTDTNPSALTATGWSSSFPRA